MDNKRIQGAENLSVPKLFWHDYLVKYLFLWLFPRFVRPNHLTIVRFLATPLVFWLLYTGNYRWGIAAFLVVALTDVLDGTMARTRNQITEWGTIYDPIADKILIGSLLLLLIFRHLNIYLVILIITLELLTLVGGLVVKKRGGVIVAMFWGKTKMMAQVVGIFFLLVYLEFGTPSLFCLAEGALGMSIIFSATNLVRQGIRALLNRAGPAPWGI